ncbi:type II secretion system protein GspH [Glaciecola punicea]|jgi:general secretion pathway protein H|uniref:type II secretion system minor pseudopilin GspH n=1 Tax=Glaciecola punicea TaxID=56804 RepID=UPI000872F823|nr:type II secretion system minor pseudopilin GspH [Glaciecola punicea]OFA31864.1 type II secretion system protein GspH [Glaciecola punicea]
MFFDLNKLKSRRSQQAGFTLLEIIIVLALIGLILASVRYTVFTENVEKDIEKEVKRLQVVFNMASDYALINQLELGLRIDGDEQSYQFVKLDDDEMWVALDNQKHFDKVFFTQGVTLGITLDGFMWEEDDSLFNNRIFDDELSVSNDGVVIGNEEDRTPPPPQVFILSSGEISPFELQIRYESQEINQEPFEFVLEGRDTVPLKMIKPDDV